MQGDGTPEHTVSVGLPEPGPDPLIDAVLSASRALVAIAARSLGDVADEVTLSQYRALVVLASRGPQRVAPLAEALGVTASTATRMCDRLVRKGLIVRRHEREDRRQVRLSLASDGRRLVDAVTLRRRQEIASLLAVIPSEQRLDLIDALTRLAMAAGEVPEQSWSSGWDL
jgi:DNA-binding MarR family transcriptional regulator